MVVVILLVCIVSIYKFKKIATIMIDFLNETVSIKKFANAVININNYRLNLNRLFFNSHG